ncbi:MAG: septum formation initiator family protein [Alphaproteobacteria bacterium]|nr:septum formation initiator family protein [Alphaproteobacteria bacterium]
MSSLVREIRFRARHILLPLIGSLAIVYFGYHAVQGDRGLFAWVAKSNEAEVARARVDALRTERAGLEHKVARLRPEGLDLDLLDERARAVLNLSSPDEIVIIERPNTP